MSRIHVLGGTGYAGGHIVSEAAQRGHEVTSYSRSAVTEPVAGVTYVVADVTDSAVQEQAVAMADVVIVALSPRGATEGRVRPTIAALAAAVAGTDVRLGVVGGAGSLNVAPGGPRVLDLDSFPAAFKAEALELADSLVDLRATGDDVDWFFVSPAGAFGAWNAGERTGVFRVGDDVLLADDEGKSDISGADLAVAIVDEIETPKHHRTRFTVAY